MVLKKNQVLIDCFSILFDLATVVLHSTYLIPHGRLLAGGHIDDQMRNANALLQAALQFLFSTDGCCHFGLTVLIVALGDLLFRVLLCVLVAVGLVVALFV